MSLSDILNHSLSTIYDGMMSDAGMLIGVAQGIAGIGALFYVSYRVWASLARAEPIDLFPLLRPFVLGICIMLFPTLVLGGINAVLSPVSKGIEASFAAEVDTLQEKREELEKAREKYWGDVFGVDSQEYSEDKQKEAEINKQTEEATEKGNLGPIDKAKEVLKKLAQSFTTGLSKTIDQISPSGIFYQAILWLLRQLSEVAILIIATLRIFFLVVLSILGPLVFGLAVWDGLSASLTAWISRYISIYLWLPMGRILQFLMVKIQGLMLDSATEAVGLMGFSNNPFDTVIQVFLYVCTIIGFCSIPTISGWIVDAGGGVGAYGRHINRGASSSLSKATSLIVKKGL